MLSQTSEYALRAMVWLAGQWNIDPNQYHNVPEIAQATKVPITYLAKILQSLSRVHILKKKRGIKGGFGLNHPPQELSLLSIIEQFDSIRRIPSCPLKLKEHSHELCPLHSKLDQIACFMQQSFSSMTLLDLVKQSSIPLCKL